MRRLLLALALPAIAVGLLTACQRQTQAPTETGVCWHMVTVEQSRVRFNPLARNVTSIEGCAAALEGMRLQFNRLGQNTDEVVGGYQGNFIWLEREGVFISQALNGTRYLALVRSGDGRLVIPGAVEQPRPGTPGAPPAR